MARRTERGRKGGDETARQLLALLGALSDEGDTVTVAGTADRLDISADDARKLLSIILQWSYGGDIALPLSQVDDDELTLAFGGGIRGRAVRLTRAETFALLSALDRVGLSDEDPLREVLRSSFSAADVSDDEVRRLIALTDNSPCSPQLRDCSAALLDRRRITFPYLASGEDASHARTRHVDPIEVRASGSDWYLDGYDLDRQAERTFRIDRMGKVADAGAAGSHQPREQLGRSRMGVRTVALSFEQPFYLELFDWPGLQVEHSDGDVVEATIEYFGGDWLVRRLAACAGTVRIHDAELACAVRELATTALDGAL